MQPESFFPVWDKLTAKQQATIRESAIPRNVEKGEVIHNGSVDCAGLLLIREGQLRAYILSTRVERLPFIGCLIGMCVCFLPPAFCTPCSLKF